LGRPRNLQGEFDDAKMTKAQQKKIKNQLCEMDFRDIRFYPVDEHGNEIEKPRKPRSQKPEYGTNKR